MVIYNLTKSTAELYESLLAEFKPTWHTEIIEEDYNLYKLGFVDEIPCTFQLDVTWEQVSELHEEVFDMETDVYIYEDILLKPYSMLSEKERVLWKEVKKREKEYIKFAPLEGLTNYLMAMEQEDGE